MSIKTAFHLTIAAFGLATFNISAATLHVSLESTNPTSPYATWATAATNIQDAVDASTDGDTVLVTNGVYSVGSRDMSFLDWNQQPPQMVTSGASRVVITNSITLESVNGPSVTSIKEEQLFNENGDATNGGRCVFLATNAVLSGFTLTNGYVMNMGDYGGGALSTATNGILTNCVITGNMANAGGGAYGCNLYNCVVTGNNAGGASKCNLYNCVLTGNYNWKGGGAAAGSVLYNCTLADNSVGSGGAVLRCTLYNCTLTGNWGFVTANSSTLYNCTLIANGTHNGLNRLSKTCYASTLYNCTVVGNSKGVSGTFYNCLVTGNDGGSDGEFYNCTVVGNNGGVSGTAYNSILYYNIGGNYVDSGDVPVELNYCCTTPLPTNGVGNITGPPFFTDMASGDFRLREGSPCIDAGTNLVGMAIVPFLNPDTEITLVPYTYETTDMLGNTRFIDGNGDGIVAWDIGAHEFNSFKPPQFTSTPQLTPDGWKLNITGPPQKWVHVQRSSNLKDWEDILYDWMGSEGVMQVNDGDTGQKVMFYRVVVVP